MNFSHGTRRQFFSVSEMVDAARSGEFIACSDEQDERRLRWLHNSLIEFSPENEYMGNSPFQLLTTHPHLAKAIRGGACPTLLHSAAAMNHRPDRAADIFEAFFSRSIALLVRLCPQAARERSPCQTPLPLHMALERQTRYHCKVDSSWLDTALQPLVEAHPPATSWSTYDLILARHFGEEKLLEQLALEPLRAGRVLTVPSAGRATCECRLLHTAVQHKASLRVLKALIAAYPEAVGASISGSVLGGRLPIHFAHSEAAVQLLLATDPQSAQRAGDDGCLPLHCACQYDHDSARVDLLIESFPAGL